MKKNILILCFFWAYFAGMMGQSSGNYGGDYNPENPANPADPSASVKYRLDVLEEDGGSVYINPRGSEFSAGTDIFLSVYVYSNYRFVRWEMNGNYLSDSLECMFTMPSHDVKIKAVFEYDPTPPRNPDVMPLRYGVSVSASPYEAGYVYCQSDEVSEGEETYVQASSSNGYKFKAWVQDGQVVSTSKKYYFIMPAKDIHLTALFEYDPVPPSSPNNNPNDEVTYTLSYYVDSILFFSEQLPAGATIGRINEPIKSGYVFDGWQNLPSVMPDSNYIVYGSFSIKSYQVIYIVDGDTIDTETLHYGASLTVPMPEKEGHRLQWDYLPSTMPDEDIVVIGSFERILYKLTYVIDNEEYKQVDVLYGDSIRVLDSPMKEGYTFSGWQEVPVTMPAKEVIIYGSYSVNKYLLTYIFDSAIYQSDSLDYGAEIILPQAPIKDGYIFQGWINLPATMPAEDLIVTASFVFVDSLYDAQGLIYALNSTRDAFEVIAYADTLQASLVIPTELYGLPVTAIAPGALAGAGHLRSIEIPSSIQTVGEGAFSECYNLLTIEWNSPAALRAACFDEPEAYGNMLLFCKTAELTGQAAADELFAGNVVIDGVAENIRLTDGRAFSNPRNFTAKNITYSREFTKETHLGRSGGWEAMVLPFAVQTVTNTQTGATLVPFAVADFTYTMPIWQAIWQAETQTFVQSQAIEANQPFLMQVPNSTEYQDQFNQAGEILFSAKNTELKAVETTTEDANSTATGVRAFSLKGAYEGMAAASDRYVINDEVFQTPDGELIPPGGAFVSDLRALRPFEAYIQLNPASNVASQTRAGYLRIGTDTSTGIESLKMTGSPASHVSPAHHWYNLQGLRLPSRPTQPGLYIHNGEKVMIK